MNKTKEYPSNHPIYKRIYNELIKNKNLNIKYSDTPKRQRPEKKDKALPEELRLDKYTILSDELTDARNKAFDMLYNHAMKDDKFKSIDVISIIVKKREQQRAADAKRGKRNRNFTQEMENNPKRKAKKQEYEKSTKVRKRRQELQRINRKDMQENNTDKYLIILTKNREYTRNKRLTDSHKSYLGSRQTYINHKIRIIKNSHKDTIDFNKIGVDAFIKLIHGRCFYCNDFTKNGYNGVDRIYNDHKITDYSKLLPCCEPCNMMRKDLDMNVFIDNCRKIFDYYVLEKQDTNYENQIFETSKSTYYDAYRKRAKKKCIAFELSKSRFCKLRSKKCTYCGIEKCNGIDRYDNDLGYTTQNAVPCCKTCNYMKRDSRIDDFIDKIKKINNSKYASFTKSEVKNTCSICNDNAIWCKKNGTENLCHWCLVNRLIFGNKDYIKLLKNIKNNIEQNTNYNFRRIIPGSQISIDYDKNRRGLYELYNQSNLTIECVEMFDLISASNCCEICNDKNCDLLLTCKNKKSDYSDIDELMISCIPCMLVKNGVSYKKFLNKISAIV